MDDLLEKQSRELQDLGEATRGGSWAEGHWLGAKSDSPLDSTPVYKQPAFIPWSSLWFLFLCIYSFFKHRLNTYCMPVGDTKKCGSGT